MPRRPATDIENLDMKWHVLRLIWPYIREFRLRTLATAACMGLAKLSSLVLPFILKYIVDNLDGQLNQGQQAGQGAVSAEALVVVPIFLILAYGTARFINVVFNELRDTIFGRVTERTMRRLSLQTLQHLHSLDLDFHLNRRTGGLSRDLERGVSGVSFLMRFLTFNIIPTLFELLIVTGIFLINYSVAFAGVILVSVILYAAFTVAATERRTRFVREMNLADSASNTRAVDSLLNYETVKYFTNEDYEAHHYDRELATWETARRNNRLSLFVLNGGQALIVAISMTTMLGLAASGVADGRMTLGDFVLVNSYMMQLFMPLNFLGFVYRELKGGLANIERMFDLLARRPAITDRDDAQTLQVTRPRVEFRQVSFNYQSDREILRHVDFTIEPGEKVAVVGPSGSGKSTLVKLLFRFYDCSDGGIRIDGHDLRELSLKSLRQAIGIVPQDTVLFNDSIGENIRYGCPGASQEEVDEAIRLAHLDGFIAQLPDGADTLVGERGLKLSGGEKQRVAIARTILKRPAILVFDEATSSLDSRTEQAILKAMREVAEGHTSLVIAHRLSTVVDADRIIVLEQGRIAETGTHPELLRAGGIYSHMWEIQQQQREVEKLAPL